MTASNLVLVAAEETAGGRAKSILLGILGIAVVGAVISGLIFLLEEYGQAIGVVAGVGTLAAPIAGYIATGNYFNLGTLVGIVCLLVAVVAFAMSM